MISPKNQKFCNTPCVRLEGVCGLICFAPYSLLIGNSAVSLGILQLIKIYLHRYLCIFQVENTVVNLYLYVVQLYPFKNVVFRVLCSSTVWHVI